MSSQTKAKQIARRGVIASDTSKGHRKRRRKKNIINERTKLLGRKHSPPLKSNKRRKKKTIENRELRWKIMSVTYHNQKSKNR
jgi:hypothetical protein